MQINRNFLDTPSIWCTNELPHVLDFNDKLKLSKKYENDLNHLTHLDSFSKRFAVHYLENSAVDPEKDLPYSKIQIWNNIFLYKKYIRFFNFFHINPR